jgi:hypothetical protein
MLSRDIPSAFPAHQDYTPGCQAFGIGKNIASAGKAGLFGVATSSLHGNLRFSFDGEDCDRAGWEWLDTAHRRS